MARDFNVLEVFVHPKFEETEGLRTHDFALLRLDYPIADNAYGIGLSDKYRKVIIELGIKVENYKGVESLPQTLIC